MSAPSDTRPEPADAFRYYLRARYSECDAQHVVFNARYGDYVDLGCTEFMKALFPDRRLMNGSFEIMTVRQVNDWKGSARFDDVIEIAVWVSKLGTTSFTLSMSFRKPSEALAFFSSESIYVHVSKDDWKKRPIPGFIAEVLLRGAPGRRVDHADHLAKA
jgi:acyl-CoA thioester hydrolase